MIAVEAMPNELCSAHEGRLAWINGCASAKDLGELIRVALAGRGVNPSSLPKLHQLALVSNQDPAAYARQHSMLSLLRVVAQPGAVVQHGTPGAATYSKVLGMQTQRQGACCCTECINEDISFWRFSWFRRTHQIIGVDWCPVHGCALSLVDDPNPFSRTPHMWLAKGKLKQITACQPILPEDGFLRRYADIAVGLLDRDKPLPVGQVNERLSQQAKALGLRTCRKGHRPLISDRLREMAPASWLAQHVRGWGGKVGCVYFHRLDLLAATIKTTAPGQSYAMIMAALYENAEAAMLAITSGENLLGTPESGRKYTSRGVKFWHGDIWSYYLECNGSIREIAKRLDINLSYLRDAMAALGLPNLHDVNDSAIWRAFIRFCEGLGIAEACAAEKVDAADLERLLRRISARVNTAVIKVRSTAENSGRIIH